MNKVHPALISETEVAEHRYLVDTRGYTLLPGFLDKNKVRALKSSLRKAVNEYKPVSCSEQSVLDRYHIHDMLNRDILFARLLEDPRLQQLVAPHLGESWIMYAMTSSSVPPGGKNFASRLHVDSPRHVPGYHFNIGLIWTLDNYTADNGGGLKVLPGSHSIGQVPDEVFFEKYCEQILCPAGTLIVFSARLFHRTSTNKTNQWNHSMTLNACRSFMKQRMDWVRFVRSDVSNQLNHQARRLIGFDTRLPCSMEEFFLPEDERLYKPNQG